MEYQMWTPEQEQAWVDKMQVPGENPIDDINHIRANTNFSDAEVKSAFGEVMIQTETWHNKYVTFCEGDPTRDAICDYVIDWAMSW